MVRNYGWPERIVVWLLTFVFLAAGGAKLAGVPDIVAVFDRFGLPQWFMYMTAAVEISGAIGLHIRKSVIGRLAPAMLTITMATGAGFHFVYDTPQEAVPAIVLALLATTVLILRRPSAPVAV